MIDLFVKRYSRDEWAAVSETAYLATFGHARSDATLRYDFALLVVREKDDAPVAYVIASENSADILQWRFGGSFAAFRSHPYTLEGLKTLVEWHRGRYKTILTLIKNDNLPSLKIHMAAGFRIFGVHHFKDETFCELVLSLEA